MWLTYVEIRKLHPAKRYDGYVIRRRDSVDYFCNEKTGQLVLFPSYDESKETQILLQSAETEKVLIRRLAPHLRNITNL